MSLYWSELTLKFYKNITTDLRDTEPLCNEQFTQIKRNKKYRLIFIRSEGNKAYPLKLASTTIPVYCHVTDDLGPCGGGGWTLAMKINGNKVALGNNDRSIVFILFIYFFFFMRLSDKFSFKYKFNLDFNSCFKYYYAFFLTGEIISQVLLPVARQYFLT